PGLPQSWRVALQLVLVAALVFLTIVQLLHLNSPAPSQARSVPTPTPTSVAPSPTAQAVVPAPIVRQPQPVPAFAPATAGRINRVEATLPSTCSAGADCRVNFSVLMSAARTPTPITWSINVFDRCTGITDTVPGGRFVAPNGWVRVELTSLVPLPARLGPQSLVVITSTPDAVAATAIEVGPSGC
ncbi:MAG: hypothetical protein M3Z13_03425, partial [Candidatus Dormibacteraeota bacterium]|nr:hypothetical protein [Candidatus Dormibacteraeota bacterium]